MTPPNRGRRSRSSCDLPARKPWTTWCAREIRDQLLTNRLESQEKQVLDQLRRQSIIEYK